MLFIRVAMYGLKYMYLNCVHVCVFVFQATTFSNSSLMKCTVAARAFGFN